MPSLLCPLFRSNSNKNNKNNKKKSNHKTKHDRNANNNASSKNTLPHKSLAVNPVNSVGAPGKRDGIPDGMSHVYHSIGTARSRSTMDTARLSALSLETNRRGHFRDDDSSLPTIDPDYNPTTDCFSLSDAGGTIGSQSLAATAFGSATRASTAFGSLPNSYLERGFYHDASYDPPPYARGVAPPPPAHPPSSPPSAPPTTNAPEPLLEIYAPPGKLGVVIDVPSRATTPVVHAIKDTCPIRNEILVGDQLLAVDDQDVTAMTAMEVSRLISRKSQQRARKLTIRRARSGGGGIRPGGGFGNGGGRVRDPRQFGLQY